MDNFDIVKDRKNLRVTRHMEGIVLPKSVFGSINVKKNRDIELSKNTNILYSDSDTEDSSDTEINDSVDQKPKIKSNNKNVKLLTNTSSKKSTMMTKDKSTEKKQTFTKKDSKIKSNNNNTIKKQETVPDSDSESEIDVEDTYHIASDSEDELDKSKNKLKSKVLIDNEYSNVSEPPVYDGVEPYFIFKRKWDAFLQSKQNKRIHVMILEFLNRLLNTKYTSLRSIKKITFDMIPTPKKFIDMMTSDRDYIETFKIKYSQNIPTIKMIDNLLAKVNFSLIEIDTGKQLHYAIKLRSTSARSGL